MSRKLLKFLCLLAVAFAACGPRPDARVGVRPVTADLVFGIPKLDEPVGLPGGASFDEPISALPEDFRNRGIAQGPQIPRVVCDEADSKQVRYQASNTFVFSPPLGGFRWKAAGFAKSAFGKLAIPSFETRKIQNLSIIDKGEDVKPPDPLEYTHETKQVETGTFANVTILWHVVKDSYVRNPADNTTVQQVANGLFIRKITKVFPNGDETTFEPRPEVLFMPFREEGDEADVFGNDSAYVDPVTQETWQLTGQVLANKSFDACGEMVDSRWVDGWLKVVSSEGTFETNYDYGVGNQYGAILLGEHREDCEKDFRYVRPIKGVPSQSNPADTEAKPEEVCQRQAGSTTIKQPPDSIIDRNIGQVPPNY